MAIKIPVVEDYSENLSGKSYVKYLTLMSKGYSQSLIA